MTQRYFLETPPVDGAAVLTGQEAQHLAKVMRAAVGDQVLLFDGQGGEMVARIERLDRNAVELSVVSRTDANRELAAPLILGVALPKGDRQRWLVEKLVELGVTRLVPLVTRRGVAQPTANALVRLQRAVIEASKQCGRNRLMQIDQPQSLAEFVAALPADGQGLLAHPGGGALRNIAPATGPVQIAVGPEGGFSDDETAQAADAGWTLVDLGPRILRIETAAAALAAYFSLFAAQ